MISIIDKYHWQVPAAPMCTIGSLHLLAAQYMCFALIVKEAKAHANDLNHSALL